MRAMLWNPIAVVIASAAISGAPLEADEAAPAPKTVRAKTVVIKKAAPPAAATPAVEVKAEVMEAAPVKPQPADKAAVAKDALEKKTGEKPAAKAVAPANLKGFGKNDAARKPAPAAAAAAPPEPVMQRVQAVPQDQMKQIAEQYKQQLRPILTSELAFIRLMCDLPMEKRKAVRDAGVAEMDAIALALAEQQNRGRALGGVRVATTTKTQAVNDPPKAIRAALDTALKDALPEDQYKAFHTEADHRKQQRKEAAIHSVVARLDGMLCLTPEVRDKMTKSIAESWQEDWERWLQMHQYGDQYFPVVPDQLISTHLNAEQRQVWTGLQKVNFGGWGNFGGGVAVADDGWWGEPLNEGAAEFGGAVFIDGAIGF